MRADYRLSLTGGRERRRGETRGQTRVSRRPKAGLGTLRSVPWRDPPLTRQSDNVPFEQSRNVPLTAPSFGDARRTATDDASRSRPAGDAEESQEETDRSEE